jgi:tRNA-uridine 2-sulfurtransferase
VPARAYMELTADDAGDFREELVVTLAEPMRGVAPGQTMVLYQGTRVLGQATIDSARSLNWNPERVSA